MGTRKKPQLIMPRAQKNNTKTRSEAPHDGKAKGSSAMGSRQNTAQRISGGNHMRVKEVVDKVKILAPKQVRSDVEKDQERVVQIGQIKMAQTFTMGPRYKRKESIESVVNKDMTVTLVQNTKTMENKKRTSSSKKQVQVIEIISSDEEEEEEKEEEEEAIVRLKKFEGCRMLAKVDRSNDHGVASRTRQRKTLRRKNSQFNYNNASKGTFSEPVDV